MKPIRTWCRQLVPPALLRLRRAAPVLALTVLLSCVIAWVAWRSPLRNELIDEARFARPHDSLLVVDRHGTALRESRSGGVDRRWVELREVSPSLIDAVIAAEDARFREHHGVDPQAMARALLTSVMPWRRLSGASTITQQTVKLVYGRDAGWLSKGLEILRAMVVEEHFSKDQILEQYLNRLPFGDRIQGVGRASEEYFGHSVSSLTVAEAALLAGIPQAPSITEPRRHLERAIKRRDYVLGRMLEGGQIDRPTFETALSERPRILERVPHPYKAPRFVDSALAAWRRGEAERTGGELRTTLDQRLQHETEQVLASTVDRFATRGVSNGAAIVIANDSGEVLAWVGAARSGPAFPGGELDLARCRRQPGSTLKPFVYELLFEAGGTPATVVDDIAVPMTGAEGAFFEAKDYDGSERGPVRARVALASSLNLAALDASRRVGADRIIGRLSRLGMRFDGDANKYGAAVVLGGADVSPLELARAYVALARGGSAMEPTMFPRASRTGHAILQVDAVAMVNDVLADSRSRADAFGRDLTDLHGGQKFALKTGTSAGWRDAWTAVFDERHTVVVWLGDPWGRPMAQVSGFEAAAPAAVTILSLAGARAGANGVGAAGPPASSLVQLEVCAATGLRAGPRCTHLVHEVFSRRAVPAQLCMRHTPSGDTTLPNRFAEWIHRTHPAGVALDNAEPDTLAAPVIRAPADGARLLIDPRRPVDVPLRATMSGVESGDVQWSVDGALLRGAVWRLSAGAHEVTAHYRGRSSKPVRVQVKAAGLPGPPSNQ